MADVFDEVDEEIKREQYWQLWKTYGPFIIGGAVAAVIGTGAYVGWRSWRESNRVELGRQYGTALDLAREGKVEQALKAFQAMDPDTGYGALAALQEGALRAKQGDLEGAAKAYDRLADDSGASQRLQNLATLLAVLCRLDTGKPEALAKRIEPLTADASPWRHSALELSGLIALRRGDTAAAKKIFTGLTDDQTAPSGVRQRAGAVLASIGG